MEHEYQALVHVREEALEAESAPSLLPMLEHDDERVRMGIAALLLDERDRLRGRSTGESVRDRSVSETLALRELDRGSARLEEVLGDVDREDAIRQFEYIRNSAIEGEIAQSEISKVAYAETRSEKALRVWVERQATTLEPRVQVFGTRPAFRSTASPNRLEARLSLSRSGAAARSGNEVVVVLARDGSTPEWRVVTERAMSVGEAF